jgi:hypothetical protein
MAGEERGRNGRLAVQRDGNGGVELRGDEARGRIASPFTRFEKLWPPMDAALFTPCTALEAAKGRHA